VTAPILTEEEIRAWAEKCCPSLPGQPFVGARRDVQQSLRAGAHFALAAAEKRMARDAEIRAQLVDRIYALLDDYGGAMTRTEKAYYEAALAAAKGGEG